MDATFVDAPKQRNNREENKRVKAGEVPEKIRTEICEKGYRNHPLTQEQKANNRKKSKVRCRIEHVFGYMTGSMQGITFRGIGITRADFNIGLTNLVYNMCWYATLRRLQQVVG